MSDSQIIQLMAETWLDNGGDAEGFTWCLWKISDRIKELEQERLETKE